jgi:hypothetical protein
VAAIGQGFDAVRAVGEREVGVPERHQRQHHRVGVVRDPVDHPAGQWADRAGPPLGVGLPEHLVGRLAQLDPGSYEVGDLPRQRERRGTALAATQLAVADATQDDRPSHRLELAVAFEDAALQPDPVVGIRAQRSRPFGPGPGAAERLLVAERLSRHAVLDLDDLGVDVLEPEGDSYRLQGGPLLHRVGRGDGYADRHVDPQ